MGIQPTNISLEKQNVNASDKPIESFSHGNIAPSLNKLVEHHTEEKASKDLPNGHTDTYAIGIFSLAKRNFEVIPQEPLNFPARPLPKIPEQKTPETVATSNIKSIEEIKITPFGKNSYIKDSISFITTAIKIIKLEINFILQNLKGNKDKAQDLRHQIDHLEANQSDITNRYDFNNKLIMPSRNLMQKTMGEEAGILNDEAAYLHNKLAPQNINAKVRYIHNDSSGSAINSKQMRNLQIDTKGGVCAGACVDFASRVLNSPLNEQAILKTATNFKSGIPAAGVINQIAYARFINSADTNSMIKNHLYDTFSKAQNADQDPFKDQIYIILRAVQTVKNKSELPPNNNVFVFVNDLTKLKSEDNLNPASVKLAISQAIAKQNPMNPNFKKIIEEIGFCVLMDATITEMRTKNSLKAQKNTAKTNEVNEKTNSIALKVFTSILNAIKKMETSYPKEIRPLMELHVGQLDNDYKINKVLEARGLKSTSNNIPDRTLNDKNALNSLNLDRAKQGVYRLSLLTGDSGHATLFIKAKNGDSFFWDPNIGLLKCDKSDPKQIILKILKDYYPESNKVLEGQEKGMNHSITFREYSKKTDEIPAAA